ncbi:hypothetical protein GCM10018793_69480 [Streptomyces sulfonofaciens]|uniref:ABC-2 type transporter transmembrane domain-containing protein n=1 Tax=Streptomyces sulfonofaciens TaxID=68272 RepID=A0A919GQ84_9ACTN|nr:ABC transporter permease [Streptomyces sulfonofaciens]GHH88727.1 hypothetical protein GCM10018793_69480 [Streptomyces sulfonofaciens]
MNPEDSGAPHTTARRLLGSPRLWVFPVLVMVVVSAVLTFAYLGGVVDPVGNLRHFPLAVVDQDRPVVEAGPQLALGRSVEQGIISASGSDDRVAWHAVSLKRAEELMNQDKIYATLVIPADFSRSALALAAPGAPVGSARQATLVLRTNPRSGSVATSLAQSIAQQVQQTVSRQVSGVLAELAPKPSTTAEAVLLANPVVLQTTAFRPLGDHSGFGLAGFYLSLLLVLGAYLGAGVISNGVDSALGYQASERGRRWTARLPVSINRTQTLLAKITMSVVLAVVTATVVLVAATFGLHMDTSHLWQLWVYAVCASAAIGIGTQAILSIFGSLGQLIGMIFFVALAVPSSGGSFPLEAVPRPYYALSAFEPMRQINDGVRALLYFDARGDAGLTRGWTMIALGAALGLLLAFLVAVIRDRHGYQRLTHRQLSWIHRAATTTPRPTTGSETLDARPSQEPSPPSGPDDPNTPDGRGRPPLHRRV